VLAFKQHCLPSSWLNTPTGILLFQCQIHLWLQCFLEESRSLMRLPPRLPTAEADLKVPFQQAATKTIGDDDKYFSRVSLRMPQLTSTAAVNNEVDPKRPRSITDSSVSSDTSPYDGWDGLTLEYSIDWPLQLLFTRDVLAK
jgi:gamma-tubulin complex component 4